MKFSLQLYTGTPQTIKQSKFDKVEDLANEIANNIYLGMTNEAIESEVVESGNEIKLGNPGKLFRCKDGTDAFARVHLLT